MVQCNGQRPICGGCLKKQLACGFLEESTPPYSSRSPSPLELYSVRPITPLQVFPDLDIRALELMRHYTTTVCVTLSGRPLIQQTMGLVVPSEATTNSCLMHGLLALSALHLSQFDLKDQRYYRAAAVRHQNLALPSLRALLNNTTEHNCDATFAAATLILIFAIAFPQSSNDNRYDSFDSFKELFTVVELMRGVALITDQARHWILKGRLEPLLRLGSLDIPDSLPEHVEAALRRLELRNETVAQADVAKEACTAAISALRWTWGAVSFSRTDHGFAMLWLGMVERSYTGLLKAGNQMALTILAHYGVVLHGLRYQWWSREWGSQLVEAACGRLDANWQPWIQWPMKQVGLQQKTAIADGLRESDFLNRCGRPSALSHSSQSHDLLQ